MCFEHILPGLDGSGKRVQPGVGNHLLINEAGGIVASKPTAKVCECHRHSVGDDRLPGGPVRPAAHRPPGHHARLGLID